MLLHLPPALHHRSFRLLWLGLMISVAGSQMQLWALFWHIRTLTDQPIALGGVGMVRIIPVVVFSLISGVIADRFNRRKIILLTQSAMVLVAAMLGWLTLRGSITLWHIYALTALQAVAIAFDQPARQALVPNLVPRRDLSSAFSAMSIAFETGAIVGPALGGMVIAYWGQPYTYLINAVSYLAVIAALLLMGAVPQEQPAPVAQRRVIDLEAIKEGGRFILKQPIILSSMVLDFFATFFSSANTLMPLFARDVLHVGAVEYGWMASAQPVGAVLAALFLSQVKDIRRQGRVLLSAVVSFGLATTLFGLARSLPLAIFALVLIGGSDSVSTIIRNTIRQLQTPDYIRGRMTSINQVFFMGGPQLGEIEAGVAAQLLGVPFAIVSGGLGCLVAAYWIIRRWPQLLRYNGDETVLAGGSAP